MNAAPSKYSSMYYIIMGLLTHYHGDISGYLSDVSVKVISPDDTTEQDLFRIRSESVNNTETLPALVMSLTDVGHILDGNPTLEKYKVRVSGTEQTNYRLVRLSYKSKLYYSNYSEALRAFEYLMITNTNSSPFSYTLPFLGAAPGTTFNGSYQAKAPTIDKITKLEDNGTIYRVVQKIESISVIALPVAPIRGGTIRNAYSNTIHSGENLTLDRMMVNTTSTTILTGSSL